MQDAPTDEKPSAAADIENKETQEDESEYPPTKKTLPAVIGLCLAVFLVALDRTIIGTAVPKITNEFNSFDDIAWYEAGFLLPLCMFQLSFGKVYNYYSGKWFILELIVVFLIGSIVSAAAPNSNALIVGRVITGIGGAGITSGAFILVNLLVPLRLRPRYTGAFGATFGISSIIGPLAGGYLTAVTWRWCFWINLPIGGLSILAVAVLCPNKKPPCTPAEGWYARLKQLDPVGFLLIAPATVCLIFALQWGGVKYAWSDARIIALFVVGALLAVAFVALQIWLGDAGTVPPSIVKQRSMLAAVVGSVALGALLPVYALYLPIYFQAIKDKSPQASGLSLLPLLLSQVFSVIFAGGVTTAVGYYTQFAILGGAISVVGAGLISTFSVNESEGIWIGYQIILGVGLGLYLQIPNIAAQTTLPKDQAPLGISLLVFIQFLAGSLLVSVCQTLLSNKLISGAASVPGIDARVVANGGATTLAQNVAPEQLGTVLEVYNDALRSIWYLGLALAALAFVGAWGYEWRSVKEEERKGDVEGGEQK